MTTLLTQWQLMGIAAGVIREHIHRQCATLPAPSAGVDVTAENDKTITGGRVELPTGAPSTTRPEALPDATEEGNTNWAVTNSNEEGRNNQSQAQGKSVRWGPTTSKKPTAPKKKPSQPTVKPMGVSALGHDTHNNSRTILRADLPSHILPRKVLLSVKLGLADPNSGTMLQE